MCKVSKDLKLCSCVGEISESDIGKLEHYWIYERLTNGEQSRFRIGETVYTVDRIQALNVQGLTETLNSRNCFDFELTPEQDDKLELYFTCKESSLRTNFEFRYKNGAWKFFSRHWDWMEEQEWKGGLNYTYYEFGRIENPLQ